MSHSYVVSRLVIILMAHPTALGGHYVRELSWGKSAPDVTWRESQRARFESLPGGRSTRRGGANARMGSSYLERPKVRIPDALVELRSAGAGPGAL